MAEDIDVSVILPIFNAECWLNECLNSILSQAHSVNIEISIFLDSCTDGTSSIVQEWVKPLQHAGFKVLIASENNGRPKGAGYAKNKAVSQSCGRFLCFMDADDVMLPNRVQSQYELAVKHKFAIVGSKFKRIPENSTVRFTKWANSLTEFQLNTQIFTSHGPTVIMPTWFCHRSIFERLNGFDQSGLGIPEDLIFFYKHLRSGGHILRSNEELLVYRYHPQATTFSIHENTIWTMRIREIENRILSTWTKFTIWNAGKQGRKFYRSLNKQNREKVTHFCDVDVNKIGSFYTYEESDEKPKPKIPIIHFKKAKPPFIICIKMDLTGGIFEENLASLRIEEGIDYHHFN